MDFRAKIGERSPKLFKALRRSKFQWDAVNILGLKNARRIKELTDIHLKVNDNVIYGHEHREMLQVTEAILALPANMPGVFVEAGSWKGASAAKLSVACGWTGRKMHIFDSFEGLPANDEQHGRNIFGTEALFPEGDYAGGVEEVRSVISRFGRVDICTFHKGWFDQTMPNFDEPVAGGYLDVDLQSSTRTCLRYLYPRLQEGGFLFSQDGHLPLIIDLLSDAHFWRDEVGVAPPHIEGLGQRKLVKIVKQSGKSG